jgi:hypothetical protein
VVYPPSSASEENETNGGLVHKHLRTLITAGALILATSVLSPMSAQAQTYSPGLANAHKVVYNAYTGNWDFHCSFSHWRSGQRVDMKCELHEISYAYPGSGELVDFIVAGENHSGSWTPPPSTHTTATYHYPNVLGQGQFCVVARGYNADGGVSDRSCN